MRHKEYVSLFRDIANRHKKIAHGRNGRFSFVRIIRSTGDPFEDKLYLEEFIRKNSSISYPALIIMSYAHSFQGDPDQTPIKNMTGLFCVINRKNKVPSNSNSKFDHLDDALDEAELISEDIIAAIQLYTEENECEFLLMDPPEGEKTGPNADDVVGQSIYFSLRKRGDLFPSSRATDETIWHSPEIS
jgi:hypothetical protein